MKTVPTYWVELKEFPIDRKVAVLKILRELAGGKLNDIKAMCEQLPARFTVQNELVAAALKDGLEEIGARCESSHSVRRPEPDADDYKEPPAEIAALHLRQAFSILDLIQVIVNQSKDPTAALQELCERTLNNALDDAMRHIEAAEEFVDSCPRRPS